MRPMIPLGDYFDKLAYPDGQPLFSYPAYEGDPTSDRDGYAAWLAGYQNKMQVFGDAEARAWQEICRQAAGSEIEVFGFRNIETNPGDLTDHTTRWTASRERIPPALFEQPIRFGPGNPSLIYNDGPHSIWNAPYKDPYVRLRARDATEKFSAAPTRRQRGPRAVQRTRVMAEMAKFSRADLENMTEESMVAEFKASRDTCRVARNNVLLANPDN